MPYYLFNIYDGQDLNDGAGDDLPDWETAQIVAIRYAGEVLMHDAARIDPGSEWRLEVADETGHVLLRMDLRMSLSATVTGVGKCSTEWAALHEHTQKA